MKRGNEGFEVKYNVCIAHRAKPGFYQNQPLTLNPLFMGGVLQMPRVASLQVQPIWIKPFGKPHGRQKSRAYWVKIVDIHTFLYTYLHTYIFPSNALCVLVCSLLVNTLNKYYLFLFLLIFIFFSLVIQSHFWI